MWFDAGDRRSRRVAVTASQRRALSPSTLLVPGQDDTHVREERSEEHAARACSRHDEGGARTGATSPAGSCADPRHPRQVSARLKGAPSGRGARGRSGPRAMGRRGGCSDGASSRRHADRCLSLADRRTGPRPSPVCSCEPPAIVLMSASPSDAILAASAGANFFLDKAGLTADAIAQAARKPQS
jgi:hypothetical protein